MDADDLFEGNFDSLDALTDRKRAVSEPDRYRALYEVYTHPDDLVPEDELAYSEDTLAPLLDVNLLAHVPGRGYRITTLGQHEIEADFGHLI